ncbi:hypothetical protein F5B20DRAFT_531200 [Whalleya microplaca]|nr:hypothetical protein F5B20DRAFT_531200 [Whalleya microplaca]
MVFVPPNDEIPRFNAYLLKPLSEVELKAFKRQFEIGTCAPFNTKLELVIKKAPEDYLNQPHSYIRIKENEAGRTDPFILIDERVVSDGAVWYVDRFADEDEVKEGMAQSTSVLWQILLKTDCLALTWVNYDIVNMTIQEDLGNCGVELPAPENFEQPEIWDIGMDMEKEMYEQDIWITAGPDEIEESTDRKLRDKFLPRPKRVARLKEGLAEEVGLINRWTIPSEAEPWEFPDGSTKEFPKGSVVLQLKYNPEFAWPAYKWPEESL